MEVPFKPIIMLQKVFKVLGEGQPINKEDLAKTCDTTVNVIANNLAILTKRGYAAQSKGLYFLTPEGRERLRTAPYITPDKRQKTPETWINDLPWEYIYSNVQCRNILVYQEEIQNDNFYATELLPYVIWWLIAKGEKFPKKFEGPPEVSKKDDLRSDLLGIVVKKMKEIYSCKA